MSKRGNTYLAILLALLAITSFGLAVFTGDDLRPVANRDLFKVIDTEKVDRVELSSAAGNTILEFENNRWRVNGKWDADMQMIKVLFATLRQVEPRRPVAERVKDSVSRRLEAIGTRITLFEGDETRLQFRAGGNELKTEAWFMKEGDDHPYLMMIPGYRVYVAGIFELRESGWRNKRIFDFNWRNFKSLTATYPKEPRENFEVEMKDRYYGIKDLVSVDTAKLNSYLDAVSLLFASRFVAPDVSSLDSLSKVTPLAKIEIKDIANRSYLLEIFPPGKNAGEVFGRLAGDQLVTFDRKAIGEIVKKREYFGRGPSGLP